MMTNDEMNQIVTRLQRHAREHPGRDSEQLIHNFLAPYGLSPTDHHGIVDEFNRRRKLAEQTDAKKGRSL